MAGIGSGVPQVVDPAQVPGGPAPVAPPVTPPKPDNDNHHDGANDNDAVTPEEQAQYDKFVKNGMEMMFPADAPGTINPTILNHLKGQFEPEAMQMLDKADPPLNPQSPVDALAGTVILVVLTLETSAHQAGTDLDDGVVLHGGLELLDQLADVAEQSGVTFADKDVEGATYRAMDLYRVTSQFVDPAQLTAEFEEIKKADGDGTLNKVLPGIGGAIANQEGAAPAANADPIPQGA